LQGRGDKRECSNARFREMQDKKRPDDWIDVDGSFVSGSRQQTAVGCHCDKDEGGECSYRGKYEEALQVTTTGFDPRLFQRKGGLDMGRMDCNGDDNWEFESRARRRARDSYTLSLLQENARRGTAPPIHTQYTQRVPDWRWAGGAGWSRWKPRIIWRSVSFPRKWQLAVAGWLALHCIVNFT
jgi:hypothetical protein